MGTRKIQYYNIDIDKLNFIISKLENVHVDQQNVNQNYINILVTDIGQVLLDSAKQTFGVKLVNTNYSKKIKIAKGINHGLIQTANVLDKITEK